MVAMGDGVQYHQGCLHIPLLFGEATMTRSNSLLALLLAALVGVGGLSLAPAQDKKDEKGGAVFEVYKDKEYRFRFKEGDTIIAISNKSYDTKADMGKVIASIQKDAAKAKVVVIDDKK